MAQLILKDATLSAAGRKKLDRLFDLAIRGTAALLDDFSDIIQERIASFAPSREEERYYLSLPGNDYDLYKREGGFLYLREAIITEEIDIKIMGSLVTSEFGNANKLNPIIGFGWWKGSRDESEFRTTADPEAGAAWRNLLQLWENGGQPFTVTSRDGDLMTIAIEGNKRTVVESVTKTIPAVQPYTMYAAGGYYSYQTLRKRTYERLKEVISWL